MFSLLNAPSVEEVSGKYIAEYHMHHKFVHSLHLRKNKTYTLTIKNVSKPNKFKIKGTWLFETDSTLKLLPKTICLDNKKISCPFDNIWCDSSLFLIRDDGNLVKYSDDKSSKNLMKIVFKRK